MAANRDVAPARQVERLDPGRPIERLGDGGTPVDDEGVQFVVGDGEAPNVVHVGDPVAVHRVIDPPKEEGLVADGQLVESVQGGAHDDVAFDQVSGAAHVRHGRAVTQRTGLVTHVIEGLERDIEEALLLGDFTLVRHRDLSFISRN